MLNRKADVNFLIFFTIFSALYILLFRAGSQLEGELIQDINPIIKTIPIWMLGILAIFRVRDFQGGWLLILGVFFGSGGDVVLSLGHRLGNLSFVLGLGLFLVGHIFYVLAFLRRFEFRLARLIPTGMALIAIIGLTIYLFPRLGDLRLPVSLYILVIFAMTVTATFRRSSFPGVMLGAFIFMISDSIIALNKFAGFQISGAWVMLTYYLAQYLIIQGSVSDRDIEVGLHE